MAAPLPLPPAPALDESYAFAGARDLCTPALVIFQDLVDANIATTLRLLNDDANRWRPHVKTAKLAHVMQRVLASGVTAVKCSTTLELLTACELGAADVLVAYPYVGANARRVRSIADTFPAVKVSVLVESEEHLAQWRGSGLGIFLDVNSGMNRTGIEQERKAAIVDLAAGAVRMGLDFRGVHYYDGHLSGYPLPERFKEAHGGYDRVVSLCDALRASGLHVGEVVTSGTPAFPCALTYAGFRGASFVHRVSPGTIVYGDITSRSRLPAELGFRPAALVLSTVVSHPTPNRVTADAGHKAVSADAGTPTCQVMGRPDLEPARPSEEHLPITVLAGGDRPAIGETLSLLPRHVCPTVNNFDVAVIVEGHQIARLERVTARGREAPILNLDRGEKSR